MIVGPVNRVASKDKLPVDDHHIYAPASLYGNWNANQGLNVGIGTVQVREWSVSHQIASTEANTEACSEDAQKPK